MGNRAVITTKKRDLEVYVHWNGGRDSVEAFLRYCELRGFRSPETDPYGWARLCQVLGNYFGADGLCAGISPYCGEDASWYDNGVYIIENWRIVERVYPYDGFKEQEDYALGDMLKDIDKAQPADQRLGGYLDAEDVPVSEIGIGDAVFMREIDGTFKSHEIVGIGRDRLVNGTRVEGLPYVGKWGGDEPEQNINNYLRGATARRAARGNAAR